MVQKSARSPSEPAARRRGRPRAFEPETALTQAMDVFWQEGFAATSLDCAQRGDRAQPSEPLRRVRRQAGALPSGLSPVPQARKRDVRPAVSGARAATDKAQAHLRRRPRALSQRRARSARLLHSLTASSDAVADPEVRALVAEAIDATDRAFGRLFADARAAGELPPGANPRALARLAGATIHTLSIRARAQIPKAEILPIIDDAVATICGPKGG